MNYDAGQLRRYARAIESTAWTQWDSSEVRKIVERLAEVIDPDGRFGLKKLAANIPSEEDRIPIHLPYRSGDPKVQRDQRTEDALYAFMNAQEAAINEIERQQARVATNGSLSLDESRELLLKTAVAIDRESGGGEIWTHALQWESNLSWPQVLDAIEHWFDTNELRSALQTTDHDDSLRLVKVTPRGRDRAIKGPQKPAPVAAPITVGRDLLVHQHGDGGIVQIGAANTAQVEHAETTSIQDALIFIKEHLAEYPEPQRFEVEQLMDSIAEEEKGQRRPSRLQTFLTGILRVTKDVGDAISPIVESTVSGVIKGLTPG